MPESFAVSLGDIVISLTSDRNEGNFDYLKRTGDFVTSKPADIALDIFCGKTFPAMTEEKLLFDTALSWFITTDSQKNQLVRVRSPQPEPYMLGRFTQDFRSGEIYVSKSPDMPDAFIFPFRFPMAEVFMMNLLGTGLGVLFHATGVIYEGRGYLFCGHGGVGKTTTARLWQNRPGARVVNDDKVIVRKRDGIFWMYGTPWHGEGGMALPDSAPLERVFVLRQAESNAAKTLDQAQMIAMLMARCFAPLWDSEKVAFSLEFLEDLVNTLPCRELGFVPNDSAVDFVLGLAEGLEL